MTKPTQTSIVDVSPNGFARHDGQWELPGYRAAMDKLEPMVKTDTPEDVRVARGKVLSDALRKLSSHQGTVDGVARKAWDVPFAGKGMKGLGINKPDAPPEPIYEPTEQEKRLQTMRSTVDNMKLSKELQDLDGLKERYKHVLEPSPEDEAQAFKFAQEQHRISELKKKLTSGN